MAEPTEVIAGTNAQNVTVDVAPTRYFILRSERDGPWQELTTVAARSAEAAIREALEGDSSPAGTYVAVPARSWKPVTVQAVQTTVLKLEEAK